MNLPMHAASLACDHDFATATKKEQLTLRHLLAVENDAELLAFRCLETGILLWPQIRTVFLRMAMSDFLYGTPLDGSVSQGVPASRAVATMGRSIIWNMARMLTGAARADVCIMSTGVGNQSVDDKLLNRLSDHFAMLLPEKTVTVEEHFQWLWPFPRHNNRVLMHAPLQAANAILAKCAVRDRHVRLAEKLVSFIVHRSQQLLDWRPGRDREQLLIRMLANKIAGLGIQVQSYKVMLHRVKPKLVMPIAGCYGPSAALIRAAKEMNIVTAEYQHGTISEGHDGYNFADVLRESDELRQVLPDYFLSYGSWWTDQVNAPVTMRAIGNPLREFRIKRLESICQPKNNILILSDGTEFEVYLRLAKQIEPQATKKGWRVVVRPHPLERAKVKTNYGSQIGAILIDQNDDLYSSLFSSQAVISELSTGLFEAVGVSDKVFVWDTPKSRFGLPGNLFQRFSSPDQLSAMLGNDNVGRLANAQIESIWAPDWRFGYAAFLQEIGVIAEADGASVHV